MSENIFAAPSDRAMFGVWDAEVKRMKRDLAENERRDREAERKRKWRNERKIHGKKADQ